MKAVSMEEAAAAGLSVEPPKKDRSGLCYVVYRVRCLPYVLGLPF